EDAEASGDSFAAAKLQPDREDMANYRKDCPQHHPADVPAGPMAGEPDGEVTFCGIEEQRECACDWSGVARDICRADISAADAANVGAAKCFYNEQAERNRAGEGGARGISVRTLQKT